MLEREPGDGPAYKTSAGDGPARDTAAFATGRGSIEAEISPSLEGGDVIPNPFTKIVINEPSTTGCAELLNVPSSLKAKAGPSPEPSTEKMPAAVGATSSVSGGRSRP